MTNSKSQPQYVIPRDPAADATALAAWHAREEVWEQRSTTATAAGAPALDRLLHLAETGDSGQIRRIAQFLGACWNGRRHFDFYDLQLLDVQIADDMLAVLDALRWARVDIGDLVPQGDARIEAVLKSWGMFGAGQTGQPIV